MEHVIVHPRVTQRHPSITEDDVLHAWKSRIRCVWRENEFDRYAAIGIDGHGRMIEMVALREPTGSWLIYHALTPPTKRMLREVGMYPGRRHRGIHH